MLVLSIGGCGDAARPERSSASTSELFLAGHGELWVVDASTGDSRRIEMPELRAGDPPHSVSVRGDRLVLWGYDTWAVDADHPDEQPDLIARDSWIWIPSAHPERVWVGYLDPEHASGERPLHEIREIDALGNVTNSGMAPPGGMWPSVALGSDLLLLPEAGAELWDPDSGKLSRRVPWAEIGSIGPAFGDQLASCLEPCKTLLLTDFSTGDRATIEAPEGVEFDVWNSEFSPDGSTLAAPVHPSDGGGAPRRLALVSVAERSVSVVPGSEVPEIYNFAVWADDGAEVFLAGWSFADGSGPDDQRIIGFRLGDERARTIPADVGRFYDAAAR